VGQNLPKGQHPTAVQAEQSGDSGTGGTLARVGRHSQMTNQID